MTTADRIFDSMTGCLIALFLVTVLTGLLGSPTVPHCPEDATIIGFGDYDNGHWTHYGCGPALDDFQNEISIP